MKILLFNLLIVLTFGFNLSAQGTQAFDFITEPHSVSSFGSGEQGVTNLSNDDALIYNPSKISLTDYTKLSYFRNPYQLIGRSLPQSNFTVYIKADSINSFAASYDIWDLGDLAVRSTDNPLGFTDSRLSERSFSAAYSRSLSNYLAAGIQLRYAYWDNPSIKANGFFLSFGLLYTLEQDKRFTFGFSLMNLGPAVKYESPVSVQHDFYEPPPAQLNLGANFISAENNYFSLPLSLSISKPFDKRNSEGQGESSFKTIFSDWSDFPDDAALHTGFSFIWKPLDLGNNFAFSQEFFAGNYSNGIKTNLVNYYTHGFNIILHYSGYKFDIGYAGISHNVHYPSYLQWNFPYETFQFSLGIDNGLIFKQIVPDKKHPALESIIISSGLGETVRLGKANSYTIENFKYSTENTLSYFFEGAFYFDKNNALVSSLAYNPFRFSFTYLSYKLIDSKFETFSFYSSYRYHLLENFHPLFIQGGLGIIRINPVIKSSPRYDYKTAFQFAAGLKLDFLDPFIITPIIDYNLIMNFITFPPVQDAPRILGYNQFNFNLKFGFKIF
jgi:hypothetical protein